MPITWLFMNEFLIKKGVVLVFQLRCDNHVLIFKHFQFSLFLQSEYIAPCHMRREFISGFSGSAGKKNI